MWVVLALVKILLHDACRTRTEFGTGAFLVILLAAILGNRRVRSLGQAKKFPAQNRSVLFAESRCQRLYPFVELCFLIESLRVIIAIHKSKHHKRAAHRAAHFSKSSHAPTKGRGEARCGRFVYAMGPQHILKGNHYGLGTVVSLQEVGSCHIGTLVRCHVSPFGFDVYLVYHQLNAFFDRVRGLAMAKRKLRGIQFDSPDEHEVFHAKESWIPVILGGSWLLLLGIIALFVSWYFFNNAMVGLVLLVLCIVAAVITRIPIIIAHLDTDIIVTNRRLYARTGIVDIKDQVCDLTNVSDVTVDPTFFGRVFDYADVRIQTYAGESDFELKHIAHAYGMRKAISSGADAIRDSQTNSSRRRRSR